MNRGDSFDTRRRRGTGIEHVRHPRGVAVLSRGGHHYELEPNRPFTVGAAPSCDLVLEDPFVSAEHCRFVCVKGAWTAIDLESTNGLRVNDVSVEVAPLPARATIQVGGVSLGFRIRTEPAGPRRFGMIAVSDAMQAALDDVERYAPAPDPVLVWGASGTGKEGIAKALHDASHRPGAFIALNCSTLSESLAESELFGHARGAFTGADQRASGAFEGANGGTLFLDEIGELPLSMQPKLLRVLETGTVRAVGEMQERKVDTRVVAATHKDLRSEVRAGRFRADLYHRLIVLRVCLPPLCERPEDIVALALFFLSDRDPGKRFDAEALDVLRSHAWPGNVRELKNVIIRAVHDAEGDVVRARDLDFVTTEDDLLDEDSNEREYFRRAIEAAGGNRAEAARRIGISRSTFYDRCRRWGI